jgi:hypothetical protein
MKTCTVCGRRAQDDAARCPYDGGPLADGVDEATLIRARPAEPVAPPRFTVEDISRPVTPVTARPPVASAAAERPTWPAAVAIAVAATIGVAAFVYYLYTQRSREVDSINARISDARVAVADAKARIESLPVENPLRQKIITLDKWDRELQGFQLSPERSSEMAARARDILREAEQISDAARGAGATMTVKPEVPPATPLEESIPAPEGTPTDGQTAPDGAGAEQEPSEPPPVESLPTPGPESSNPDKPSSPSNTNSAAPGSQPLPPPPAPPPPASGNTSRQDNSNKDGL